MEPKFLFVFVFQEKVGVRYTIFLDVVIFISGFLGGEEAGGGGYNSKTGHLFKLKTANLLRRE